MFEEMKAKKELKALRRKYYDVVQGEGLHIIIQKSWREIVDREIVSVGVKPVLLNSALVIVHKASESVSEAVNLLLTSGYDDKRIKEIKDLVVSTINCAEEFEEEYQDVIAQIDRAERAMDKT